MIEVKKKYVYEINNLEKYYGMMPLDVYITMVYFNYENDEDYAHIMLSLGDLSHCITQNIVEAITSTAGITPTNFDLTAKDIFISAIPDLHDRNTKLIIVINLVNKRLLISEARLNNHDGLKMQNYSKENLLSLMLSVHNLSLVLMRDVIEKCNNAKKLSLVGVDEKKEEPKKPIPINAKDEFNMDNYVKA